MIYLLIVCLVIIGFLGYKLYKKQKIDQVEIDKYEERKMKLEEEIESISQQTEAMRGKWLDYTIRYNSAKRDTDNELIQLKNYKNELREVRSEYDEIVGRKTEEINKLMDEQRQQRQEELDRTFEEKKELMHKQLEEILHQCDQDAESAKNTTAELMEQIALKVKEYQTAQEQERERFESLRKPLQQYEMEKQQRIYYTIQLPEEYHDDIEFLLTTVAAKVQHPDIISKLVWAEYVKPNLDNTFKRIEIKAEPGIYKLTSLDNGKSYIGKSTDVKKRIADHFKSSIGIRSIADQAVHHAILKEGFWNWTIEVLTYCDKDKLAELEKYYIDFFKTQEYGYNKNAGGGG